MRNRLDPILTRQHLQIFRRSQADHINCSCALHTSYLNANLVPISPIFSNSRNSQYPRKSSQSLKDARLRINQACTRHISLLWTHSTSLYPAISEGDIINPKDLKNRPYYRGQREPKRFSASWPERIDERPTLPQLILRSLSPNSAVPAAPCSELIYSVDCLNLPLLNTTCHMSKTISQHGRSHILSCHTDPDRERVTTSMIFTLAFFPKHQQQAQATTLAKLPSWKERPGSKIHHSSRHQGCHRTPNPNSAHSEPYPTNSSCPNPSHVRDQILHPEPQSPQTLTRRQPPEANPPAAAAALKPSFSHPAAPAIPAMAPSGDIRGHIGTAGRCRPLVGCDT